MADSGENNVAISSSFASKLIKWKVNEGQEVKERSVLALYEKLGQSNAQQGFNLQPKLRSNANGRIKKLLVAEGDVVPAGKPVIQIESAACEHNTVMKDLCCDCGIDLRKLNTDKDEPSSPTLATVSMIHNIPELRVTKDEAEAVGKKDEERLLNTRKLALVVDLDQTMIHTTIELVPNDMKDVYHFNLSGYPLWYHTKFRPFAHEFLEKMAKLYELHIFTMGSRMYAHTIARMLDPDERLFGHRIRSRDDCFNAFSKSNDLRSLFPRGDSMVCIIDDRNDVWNNAPNLIKVKPYQFFKGVGDINAPADKQHNADASDEKDDNADETEASEDNGKATLDVLESANNDDKECKHQSFDDNHELEGQNDETNKINEMKRENKDERNIETCQNDNTTKITETTEKEEHTKSKGVKEKMEVCTEICEKKLPCQETFTNRTDKIKDENYDSVSEKELTVHDNEVQKSLDNDVNHKGSLTQDSSTGNSDLEDKTVKLNETDNQNHTQNCTKSDNLNDESKKDENGTKLDINKRNNNDVGECMKSCKEELNTKENTPEETSAVDLKEKEIKPESGEKLRHDIVDEDDYLVHLEDILTRIHETFYNTVDQLKQSTDKKETDITTARYCSPETRSPCTKQIIKELQSQVLKGANIVFTGVIPTNTQPEKSDIWQRSLRLGAKVSRNLITPKEASDPSDVTTHVVAARLGTEKTFLAISTPGIKIVKPDWLWCCDERWEWADERLFAVEGIEKYKKELRCHRNPQGTPQSWKKSTKSGNSSKGRGDVDGDPQDETARERTCSSSSADLLMASLHPLLSFSSTEMEAMDKEVEDLMNSDLEDDSDVIGSISGSSSTSSRPSSSSSNSSSSSSENEDDNALKSKRKRVDSDNENISFKKRKEEEEEQFDDESDDYTHRSSPSHDDEDDDDDMAALLEAELSHN